MVAPGPSIDAVCVPWKTSARWRAACCMAVECISLTEWLKAKAVNIGLMQYKRCNVTSLSGGSTYKTRTPLTSSPVCSCRHCSRMQPWHHMYISLVAVCNGI
jgi:hypothetical protein